MSSGGFGEELQAGSKSTRRLRCADRQIGATGKFNGRPGIYLHSPASNGI